MAKKYGDFLAGEEIDDLYFLLDGGFLDDDAEFNVEIYAVVSEVADDPSDSTYRSEKVLGDKALCVFFGSLPFFIRPVIYA